MVNLYSAIKESCLFKKIEIDELLFVEYTCMQDENKLGIWSHNNYFAFIASGKKQWKSIHHCYEVEEGDIIFVKKGAHLTHQFFDDEFCAIFIFIPDDFIRSFLQKNSVLLNTAPQIRTAQDTVLPVQPDELLQIYYQSIRSWLSLPQQPNKQLLLLKFEELLLSLFSNEKHRVLTDYFLSLCESRQHQLRLIMEKNFAFNLKLEEYARLCHMSLSSFKQCFRQYYHTSPGAWLKNKKLELSVHPVITTRLSISQIAFECGFEDTSHFIRLFKEKYQYTPLQYRQKFSSATPAPV